MSSHMDSSNDTVLTLAGLKEELLNVLSDAVDRPVEMSVRANVAVTQDAQAPNPCLDIQDTGVIGLPLASFRGLPVSLCWSSSPEPMYMTAASSELKFKNPRWDDWVSSAAKSMVAKLGGPVRDFSCQFEHLMLFREGFSQNAYIQEEGAAAFAHMIIILPGHDKGSVIQVKLDGREETMHCHTDNSQTSVIAWPADATFEIQPITAGFQTVLSYHLKTRSGSTFKDWFETCQIPHSPDRSIDEINISSALWKWKTAVRNLVNLPKSLFFLVDVGCDAVEDYADHRFDAFDDHSSEDFYNFLSRLGGELGFTASVGHIFVTFTGRASSHTYPERWDVEADDWDWDDEDMFQHHAGVFLESENIHDTSRMFTPVSGAGLLDRANARELTATEVLDPDWVPDGGDLRCPEIELEYEGWQGGRYDGESGNLSVGFYRAAIQITLL